jgi:hypothetical protein
MATCNYDPMTFSPPWRRRAALFLFSLLSVLSGCSAGIGDVSGTVTHQGKKVVCGSVVLAGPDGMTKVGAINPEGTYTVKGVGAGRVRVAVFSLDPARPLDPYRAAKTHGKAEAEPPADADRNPDAGRVVAHAPADRSNWAEPNVDRSKWFPLPKKYERVDQSGLTFEIKAGENTGVNIDLK